MGLAFLITTDKLQILSERKVLKQLRVCSAARRHEHPRQRPGKSARGCWKMPKPIVSNNSRPATTKAMRGTRSRHAAVCRCACQRAALAAMKHLMAELVTRTVREAGG
ncbi:hypothetical protein ACU4HD_43845 [Cupriavidus basilensis]